MYDVIVVGGGAAGLTSAIYTTRRQLKTLVISEDIGGQTNMTPHIENYPGIVTISGPELMQVFYKQALHFGSEFVFSKVLALKKKKNSFILKTEKESFETRSVILACGLTHRGLNIENEKDFHGKGISFCATCDGPLFKGKNVVVVGDSFMAMDAAYYLSALAKHVTYIILNEKLLNRFDVGGSLKEKKNVTILPNAKIVGLKGDQTLTSISVLSNEQEKEIACNGLFIKIGLVTQTKWLSDLISLDSSGHILADDFGCTNVKGVFACGDICQGIYKQVVIASGMGAKAALSCYKFLQDKDTKQVLVDWTTH